MKPRIEVISQDSQNVGEKKRKPRKFNIYRLMVVTIITAFLASVTYVVATAFMRSNPTFNPRKHLIEFHQTIKNPGQLAFGQQDRILILCLGLDENRDEKGIAHTKGSRTDTIFILNLDRRGEKLGILSIPRDTYIYRGEWLGYGKVNAAFTEAFWEEYEQSGYDYEKAVMAGVITARKVISDFLEVDIDYYVLIKIQAGEEVMDAVGGVTVDVEKDMSYDDYWGNLHIHLKEGRQRLSGYDAMGYARFRYDEEGDWGRIRRQQQVIQALTRELKKPANIMRINQLAKVVKNNLNTNLDTGQLVDIANVYRHFDPGNTVTGVLSGYDDWAEESMVVVPHQIETERLVRRVLRSPDEVIPEDIRVRIWNRDAQWDQVYDVADRLRDEGYTVMEVSQVPRPVDDPWDAPPDEDREGRDASDDEDEEDFLDTLPESDGDLTDPSPHNDRNGTDDENDQDPRDRARRRSSVAPVPVPTEPPYPGTEIVDHFGNRKGRRMLENSIRFYSARVTRKPCDNREAPSDFTLILAEDYHQMHEDPSYSPPPPPRIDLDSPGTFQVHESPIVRDDYSDHPDHPDETGRPTVSPSD